MVAQEKAEKWRRQIDEALASGKLDPGSSQKLAGRLMWATQHLFYRVGRAMIKPIYAQKMASNGLVGPRLRAALEWWSRVLGLQISETRPWILEEDPPCHMFVDAASTPAR